MAPGRGVVPRRSPKKLQKPLVTGGNRSYLPLAQFRTCLWSRAGWWASGQEAGQPPESNLALDTPNRQPEAKPAHPVLNGERGLKQRRTGFFGLVGPPKVSTEEACFSLPGVRSGAFPFPIQGSIVGCRTQRPVPCLH